MTRGSGGLSDGSSASPDCLIRDDRIYGRNRQVRSVAFDNGYGDGYEKGLSDARDRHSFDPTRHKWYRSGDRHYESRYGSRAQYENIYRLCYIRGPEQILIGLAEELK